jgi:hypothetical protein
MMSHNSPNPQQQQQQQGVPLLLLLAQTSPLWSCRTAQHTTHAQTQILLTTQQQQQVVASVCVPARGAWW